MSWQSIGIQYRPLFVGAVLLALVACGGGGGGGGDDAPADTPPGPGLEPATSGTYAFNTDSMEVRCGNGSTSASGQINQYIDVSVADRTLFLGQEFSLQIPGFVIDSQSQPSGSIDADGTFSATGWVNLRALDLPELVTVNVRIDGQMGADSWSGTYAADLQMPNGLGCEGEVPFNGNRGLPGNLGGIWEGTITVPGDASVSAFGFTTASGELRFVTEAGEQAVGAFTLSGDDVRAQVMSYAPLGSLYPNGMTVQPMNATGKLQPRTTLSGSASYGGVVRSVFDFRYNTVYERLSSLAIIAGSYSPNVDLYTGEHYIIDEDGVLSGGNGDGCSYYGKVWIIDPNRNLYRLNLSVSNCGELDGAYSGLGALTDKGGVGNDTLAYSLTGDRWIVSGTVPRHASSPPPQPQPPTPEPPTPQPPVPQPPGPTFPDNDDDGNAYFDSARSISDAGSVTDTVTSRRDADFFYFTASETARYTVTLAFSAPDMSLFLYNDDANATLVGQSRERGASQQQIANVQLEQGKRYYVGVQAVNQDQQQSYSLAITSQPVSAPGFPQDDVDDNRYFDSARSVGGRSIWDEVTSQRDADFFVFTASETANYSFILGYDTPNMALYVYNDDTNKTLLGESNLSGSKLQSVSDIRLQAGQRYYIGVQAIDQSGEQPYEVIVSKRLDPEPGGFYTYIIDSQPGLPLLPIDDPDDILPDTSAASITGWIKVRSSPAADHDGPFSTIFANPVVDLSISFAGVTLNASHIVASSISQFTQAPPYGYATMFGLDVDFSTGLGLDSVSLQIHIEADRIDNRRLGADIIPVDTAQYYISGVKGDSEFETGATCCVSLPIQSP